MWTVWLLEGRLGEKWVERKADRCPSRNAEVKNVCSLRMASQHGNKLCRELPLPFIDFFPGNGCWSFWNVMAWGYCWRV
jgi:hypothetical protein